MIKLLNSKYNLFYLLLFFSVNLRVSIILIDVYFLDNFLSQNDSIGFHLTALDRLDVFKAYMWAIDNNVHFFTTPDLLQFSDRHYYPLLLSFFYWLFSGEYLIGVSCSLFFWIINLYFLKKILDYISNNYLINNLALILFCFLPSSILFSTLILRESLQALLLVIILFYSLIFYYERKTYTLLIILLSFFILFLSHAVYLFIGLAYVFVLLTLFFLKLYNKLLYVYFFILILLITIFTYSDELNKQLIEYFNKIAQTILQRNGISVSYNGRTDFINIYEIYLIDRYLDFFKYLFSTFLKYLFYPLSYFSNFIMRDFIFIFENIIRLFLIVVFLLNLILSKKNFAVSILILILYILNEFLWSLGTVNFGTAIRHHYPTNCILIILTVFTSANTFNFNLKKIK